MGFLKNVFNFVRSPTHSRTKAVIVLFLILAAIPLTVIISQQQQQLRQRAQEADCKQDYTSCVNAYNSCNQRCSALDRNNYASYDDYTQNYNVCTNNCANNDNTCNQNVDNAYTQCLALFTAPIPTPTPTLAPTPTPTSTPTPPISASVPSPTPIPATANAICPIETNDNRIVKCDRTNPNIGVVCNPLYQQKGLNPCQPDDICWICRFPTPTPTPSALCNDSNTVDNECFKRNGVFCAVGSSCKQNINNPIKDCTCQSSTPTLTPTPTPVPSNICGFLDCLFQICAPGFACLQDPNPNVTTKSCACRSTQPTSTPTPTPSPTATSAPTPLPGSSLLALSVKVPGLGLVPPENLPRTKSRTVKVIVRTATGDIEKTGVINFDSSDGLFKTDPKRSVDLGTSIPINTPLDLVIKVDFFKGFASNVSLSAGPNPAPKTPTLQVGLDDSGNVDAVSYFNALISCFGTKSCTNKLAADLNDDGSVDGVDFNIFLKSIITITSR